jgi:hypothetical protein
MQVCRATAFGAGKQIQKSKEADNTRRMSVPGTRIHWDAATNAEYRMPRHALRVDQIARRLKAATLQDPTNTGIRRALVPLERHAGRADIVGGIPHGIPESIL